MDRITIVALLLISLNLNAQKTIALYSENIPNNKPNPISEILIKQNEEFFGYTNVSEPTLQIYLPNNAETPVPAVIICPGGGYEINCYQPEGVEIANAFLRNGIAAIILKYRLPNDSIMIEKTIGPLQDAQQAIKTVRQHSSEWNLDQEKIGIMGFSAGGHLASTAGTHFQKSYIPNEENINLRPDFMILIYPVISMKEGLTHKGTRVNLLGESPAMDKISFFSNELQIHSDTPPTWLTHTGDDSVVPVENSIRFYQALIQNGIKAEMHLYPTGNHGFVLNLPTNEWMQPLFKWMKN